MRRLKALFLLGCFCVPFLLTVTGCEQEPKKHVIYREKVQEDKKVTEPVFLVE